MFARRLFCPYFVLAFQWREYMRLNRREQNRVAVDLFGIQGFGDLVYSVWKPKIWLKCQKSAKKAVKEKVPAKAVLSLLRFSFPKGGVDEVKQAETKPCSGQFPGNPRSWRFSIGSLEAEHMIKVPKMSRKSSRIGSFVPISF